MKSFGELGPRLGARATRRYAVTPLSWMRNPSDSPGLPPGNGAFDRCRELAPEDAVPVTRPAMLILLASCCQEASGLGGFHPAALQRKSVLRECARVKLLLSRCQILLDAFRNRRICNRIGLDLCHQRGAQRFRLLQIKETGTLPWTMSPLGVRP